MIYTEFLKQYAIDQGAVSRLSETDVYISDLHGMTFKFETSIGGHEEAIESWSKQLLVDLIYKRVWKSKIN